ncbi:MAG: hypothetical protein H0V45_04510, partial [Actinobacteria bacterium]|nr:hypothetical protein [Actinomycetota bacterium]
ALSVPRVREIHNLSLVTIEGAVALSLHLKLPGDLPLEEAHDIAEEVERTIRGAVPEVGSVQTHLEPLAEPSDAVELEPGDVEGIVRAVVGAPPRAVRVLRTDEGLVAFLTLGFDPESTLASAHARASEVEDRLRAEYPEIADVIVHTEP